MRIPRLRPAVLVLLVIPTMLACLIGCSASNEPSGASRDCSLAIRLDGREYRDVGFTHQTGEVIGFADVIPCSEGGEASPTASQSRDRVEAVRVKELAPTDAVAVFDGSAGAAARVYVSVEVPSVEVDSLVDGVLEGD